jgi:hypothetical protein
MSRLAYFVNDLDEDGGTVIPCICEENSPGYHRTNWSWNCSKKEAKELVVGLNTRMGISKKDADIIMASSMRAQFGGGK